MMRNLAAHPLTSLYLIRLVQLTRDLPLSKSPANFVEAIRPSPLFHPIDVIIPEEYRHAFGG